MALDSAVCEETIRPLALDWLHILWSFGIGT